MKRMRGKQGFTLMEMLIVVAIVAILVAIAIPVFNNALNSARQATDDANARSLKATVAMTELLDEIPTASGTLSAKELMAFCGTAEYQIKYYYTEGGSLYLGNVERKSHGTSSGSIQSFYDLLGIRNGTDLLARSQTAWETGYRAQTAGEGYREGYYLCMTVTATKSSVTRTTAWEPM